MIRVIKGLSASMHACLVQYLNNMITALLQSFLVPLQGFLNAIVYGWTREDFAQLMAIGRSHFDGWDLDGSEEETDAAPAVIEESDAHSMHSNLRVRCGSRHEVEDSVAPDETDGSS